MIERATVGAYGDSEQITGWLTMMKRTWRCPSRRRKRPCTRWTEECQQVRQGFTERARDHLRCQGHSHRAQPLSAARRSLQGNCRIRTEKMT
jgi:hypothetical protein